MVPRNYGYILKLKHRGDCERQIVCVFTSALNKHSKSSASEAEQALLYLHCLLEAPCALTQDGECRLDLHSLWSPSMLAGAAHTEGLLDSIQD